MIDEEKRAFLSLTGYGLHSSFEKELKRRIERDFGLRSIFIYEYFLDEPAIKDSATNSHSAFAPFLLRLLNEINFVPRISESFPENWANVERVPYSYDDLKHFWHFSAKGARTTDLLKYSILGKKLIDLWKGNKLEDCPHNLWMKKEAEEEFVIIKANLNYRIDYLKSQYLSDISYDDKISKFSALKEYMISVLPWLYCPRIDDMNIAALSISSEKIFYGYILIFYPHLKEGCTIFYDKNGIDSDCIKYLKNFIKSTYIPMLALAENYWEEKVLEMELISEPNWNKFIFLDPSLEQSRDSIEKGLHQLWKARKSHFTSWAPKQQAITDVSESLLFGKYLIASSENINEIKKIIIPRNAPNKGGAKEYLPCVLVVGAPGSGKDVMAKMVRLFFPKYRFGRMCVINMASLKPNEMAVPLMSGFEAVINRQSDKGGNIEKYSTETILKGVFAKIWDEHKKEFPTEEALQKARDLGKMPVVILDELNSLEIDAQGALLRILQNSELEPLGSCRTDDKVDFLVIGVVNEAEDTLTLEEPLRKFLAEKGVFGGVLGRVLYEYFRNIRRLRDDLYYRMVRDGRIIISNLENRRQDIPILFSFFVKKEMNYELGNKIGWDQLWFDLDIFEELMNETIPWSGNFRELESVAKRTAYNVLQDEDNKNVFESICKGDKEEMIHISLRHIRAIMKEFYNKEI